ncbi:MAG: J domain-containing protein [Thermoproteota archaeon]|nr:J domain-containing protein [Nitrosopumilus sp.]MDQ3084386.1 J domain-containing protein [Thermoproteota archaeon]
MDHYEILGIDSNASSREITFAYRRLALQYHPDRNKTPLANEMMLKINISYSILSDPNKRSEYDSSRIRGDIQSENYDSTAKTDVFTGSNVKTDQKESNSSVGTKYVKYGLIALLTIKFVILELRKWMQRIF